MFLILYIQCITIYSKADLPDGVVNIVYGTGPQAGEALVTHPDVPLVSYLIHLIDRK